MVMGNFGGENTNNETPFAGRVNIGGNAAKSFSMEEAFKTLRANILFTTSGVKTMVVTSCTEGEGKSTVSKELAKSFAELGKKTLFIDADMRRSVILKKNLKNHSVLGLSEFISGNAPLEKVLYKTQLENLDIIFTGAFPNNPVELLSGSIFKTELEKLKENYEIIIIDTPPLGPVIDAAVIASMCDGVLLVIAPSKANINEIQRVKNQIEVAGCKILGAVINEVDSKHTDTSKPYGKYYYSEKPEKSSKKAK